MDTGWIAAFAAMGSLIVAVSTILFNITYRAGQTQNQVSELLVWKANVRSDMHEISDKLEDQNKTLGELATLIKERTERRQFCRLPNCPANVQNED